MYGNEVARAPRGARATRGAGPSEARVPRTEMEVTMRTKNLQLIEDIRKFIAVYYQEHLETPGIELIAKNVGSSKSNVQRYLIYMNEQGILEYQGGIRNPETLSRCTGSFSAHPITGNIHCGDPRLQEEMIEEYVVLPDSIFGQGEVKKWS